MTELINGYEIIAQYKTPADRMTRAGRVVLVDRGPNGFERYVTGWAGDGDDGWCSGHYFNRLEAARQDFATRCARNY